MDPTAQDWIYPYRKIYTIIVVDCIYLKHPLIYILNVRVFIVSLEESKGVKRRKKLISSKLAQEVELRLDALCPISVTV